MMGELPKTVCYKMANTYVNATCYVDEAVLVADPEDNMRVRLLHSFSQLANQLNTIINTDRTKCLVTSKEWVRCKLEVGHGMIEQVNRFKYLRANTTSAGNLDSDVRERIMKASQILGHL
ncbi:hypothetical protein Trydic_g1118 [Trypoxylus dichotomus]